MKDEGFAVLGLLLFAGGLSFMYARPLPVRLGGLSLFVAGTLILRESPQQYLSALPLIAIAFLGCGVLFRGAHWVPLFRSSTDDPLPQARPRR